MNPDTADEECYPEALIYEIGEDGNLSDVRSEPMRPTLVRANARKGKDN